jgi:hypothetical protein
VSEDIRETVREKYAAAARAVVEQQGSATCCGPIALTAADKSQVFGAALYDGAETEGATVTAVAASLGSRPRSRICTRERRSWTSVRAPARTC